MVDVLIPKLKSHNAVELFVELLRISIFYGGIGFPGCHYEKRHREPEVFLSSHPTTLLPWDHTVMYDEVHVQVLHDRQPVPRGRNIGITPIIVYGID